MTTRRFTPPPIVPERVLSRDEQLYHIWRNRHCPTHGDTTISCFGSSPLYGASGVARAVAEHYGCATIADLRDEVRRHAEPCRCWKHAILRHHRILQEDS